MVQGYEKIRTIGKGSFGTASLYTRLNDQKLVVLKEIATSDMDYEEKTSAYNEINILSALDHENIIRYFDSIINQHSIIIVMDYANGGNLAQLLHAKKAKNEAFKEKGILYIIFQISNALAYIHGKKILHRDLKPANIFLTSNGCVRIGDFGISKILSTKSQAQSVVGTPYYLSPEMCEGREYNEKSDIWALGCIIYEMATFKKPFVAPNLPLLVQKIIKCEYEAVPKKYCKDLTILVELILQKKITFRPTASFIYDVIVPDILAKNCITLDYQCLENGNTTKSTKERSVLYELTNDDGDINVRPVLLPHKKIIDFSISSSHLLVVFKDHSVYACGSNKYCELGAKNSDPFVTNPVYVRSLEHLEIVKCNAGQNFSLFLTKSGQIYSCGRGNSGCLGHGNLGNVYFPILLKYLSKVSIKDICCGKHHVVALDNVGKIYIWGSSKGFDNTGKIFSTPKHVALSEEIQNVYCSSNSIILLSVHNALFVSGNNNHEKLGIKNRYNKENIIYNFQRISNMNVGKILDISMSERHTVIVNSEGQVLLMGDNSFGQLGKTRSFLRRNNENLLKMDNRILKCACNNTFSSMFDEKNVLWICGTFKYSKRTHFETFSGNDRMKNHTVVCVSQDHLNDEEFDESDDGLIKGVKSILALYSSKANLRSGIHIIMTSLEATEKSLFLLVNTTCPPSFKNFEESYKPNTFSNITYGKASTRYETE